jgi:transposase
MLKIQLYGLIKTQNCSIDTIMAAHGHTVLRPPAYHPDSNPIELVWADVKQSAEAEKVPFNLDEVTKMCGKLFSESGIENWKKVSDCTEKNEKGYIEN